MTILHDFQQRVVDEMEALRTKFVALGSFFDTDKFETLRDEERKDLKAQYHHMEQYLVTLERRVARWMTNAPADTAQPDTTTAKDS